MPIIALSPMWDDQKGRSCMTHDYVTAVAHAGGTPVILPFLADERVLRTALSACDGLILTGGADIDPALYHEEKLPCCGNVSAERDKIDYALTRTALELKKPILAICRGIQVLNCVLGGTLYQDIATQFGKEIAHPRSDIPGGDAHLVNCSEGSLLRGVLGVDTSFVNSRHHQAVKNMAEPLKAVAFAPDGLIEAVEMADGSPVLGVQWHPESLEVRLPEQRRLFSWLMDVCAS